MKKRANGRLTYANVISTLCLFLLLGGGAYAAIKLPKNSVGSKQLKKNAVTSVKVKDHSLAAGDFAANQLPAGPPGPRGDRGPSDAYYVLDNTPTVNSKAILLPLPAGNYAVTASMVAGTNDVAHFGEVVCYLNTSADPGHYGITVEIVGPAPGLSNLGVTMMNAQTVFAIGTAGGTITYSCSRHSGEASVALYQARIIATQVETLH